jgi:tetratricopeptide (TPR) repeat protein
MPHVDKPLVSSILVDRMRELEALEQAAWATARGRGRCLLVAGEAGVGKSRLVTELCARVADQHFLILRGYCADQDVAFPFAPWIDLLRTFFARLTSVEIRDSLSQWAPEFIKLLPELLLLLPDVQPTAMLDPEAEKRRLFEVLAQYLTRLSDANPLLVVVEDLHWSDETSLNFLQYFARRLVDSPILLIATYRPEEIPQPLTHLLTQLNRKRLVGEIVLDPLARQDVAALVQAIFEMQEQIKDEFLDLFTSLTEGNPFFIEELLRAMVEAGDIVYVNGRWAYNWPLALHIPRSVQETVAQRIAQLDPEVRHVLGLAAVAGQRFDFALLQVLTGQDEATLVTCIKEIIAVQLVVEAPAGHFAFRHALTRQAIMAKLLAVERKMLHRCVAEAIQQLHAGTLQAHLSNLAYHCFEAGIWDKALDYSMQAGQKAQALYALQEAREHFSRAVEAAHKLSIPPPLALLQARAKVCETLGDFEQARIDLETLLQLAKATGDDQAEWQAYLDFGFLWAYRNYDQSGDYFRRALDMARRLEEPATLAPAFNRLGNWHFNCGRPVEALAYHREALDLFWGLKDRTGIAETLDLLGVASYGCGDLVQGVAYLEEAASLFSDLGDQRGLAQCLAALSLRIRWDTEVLGAVNLRQLLGPAQTALDVAHEIGWRSGEVQCYSILVDCLARMGDYARAFQQAQTGLAIAEEIQHRVWVAMLHAILGQSYLSLFAFAEAQSHLEQAIAVSREVNALVFIQYATLTLVSVHCLQGNLQRAEAYLNSVPDSDLAEQAIYARCRATVQAELALTQGDAALALQIVERLIASAANIDRYGPHAIPRLSILRGEILFALARYQEAEEELLAAREITREQGRRPLLWRIHARLGTLERAMGSPAAAEREFEAARLIVEELSRQVPDKTLRSNFLQRAMATISPVRKISARQAAKEAFGGLTERERQVAALIARGKSNRAIAETLVIAEATTEKHVVNILSKLGFASRVEVAAWAAKIGLSERIE